jgi:hypothetical protein
MGNKSHPDGMFATCIEYSRQQTQPGPVNEFTTPRTIFMKWIDSFSGIDNPYWRSAIRQQSSATTPASGKKTVVHSWPYVSAILEAQLGSFAQGNLSERYFSYLGTPTFVFPPPSFPESSPPGDTVNRVIALADSRFLDLAKSAISSFQSGQDIAELHQTIESVIHPMASLRKHVLSYFSSLRKLKTKYKRGPLISRQVSLQKALSDTYLEWTFGWNPLAADIAQGLVDLSRTRFESTPVKASAHEDYSVVLTDLFGGQGTCHTVGHRKITSRYSVRLKGAVNAFYSKQPRMLQELQLLPEDFAPTAWNVLPYSFVIDYFLNIGDVIDGFSFPSAALRWCNKSTVSETIYRVEFTQDVKSFITTLNIPASGYRLLNSEISSAPLDVAVRQFARQSITASDLVPPLVIHIPPLSAKPWLNIAALINGSKRLVTPFF